MNEWNLQVKHAQKLCSLAQDMLSDQSQILLHITCRSISKSNSMSSMHAKLQMQPSPESREVTETAKKNTKAPECQYGLYHLSLHYKTNKFQQKPVEILVTAKSGDNESVQCVDVVSTVADDVAGCKLWNTSAFGFKLVVICSTAVEHHLN